MSLKVNIHEAKTQFSKLLKRVGNGEEIIICKAGKPIARLTPMNDALVKRIPGSAKGEVLVAEDFDAPLPDSIMTSCEQ